MPIGASGVTVTREVRGQLSPRHHTVLSSELPALITTLDLREGESFKKGILLVGFDCAVYDAQLQKARAAAKAAECRHKVNTRLDQLNAVSTLEVEQAENLLAEAAAQVRIMEAHVDKCEIRAPFSGRIVKRLADPYQYTIAGTPLLEILDPRDLEIQLIVPSAWLGRIDKTTDFEFYVEENKKSYPARVIRMGTRVDPVSQSILVVGKIKGRAPDLLPGMSGLAQFSLISNDSPISNGKGSPP